MLRFLHDPTLQDAPGFTLRYNPLITFLQSQMVAGPRAGVLGMWNSNNAFGEANWTRELGSTENVLFIQFWLNWLNQTNTPNVWTPMTFFKVGDTGDLFALKITNAGALVATDANQTGFGEVVYLTSTAAALPVSHWQHVEMKLVFGPSGSFEIRIDGGVVLKQSRPMSDLGRDPDRFTFRGANFAGTGPAFASVAVMDASGSINNDWTGRTIVVSMAPAGEVQTGWRKNSGWVSLIDAIADTTTAGGRSSRPDGDLSFATRDARAELVQLKTPSCFGRILGIAGNIVARPIAVGQLQLYVRPKQLVYPIGAAITTDDPGNLEPAVAALAHYRGYQRILELSPASSTYWTDGELAQSGLGWDELTGSHRVTQFFIEKLVSLDPMLRYDCGSGSYVV